MNKKAIDRFYVAIGNELRMARSKKGFSQTDLFHKTGIHRETISRIESGLQHVSVHYLVVLCHHLDLTTDQILKGLLDYEIND